MIELYEFVKESNRIEGILRAPTDDEMQMMHRVITAPARKFSTQTLIDFVGVYQPNAEIRKFAHLNVRVGEHIAPAGGPQIVPRLEEIVENANRGQHPYKVHVAYENLHPFTDGNGRSGRALWLWQMVTQSRGAPLGFLHHFYYQTLEHSDGRK